MKLALFRIFWLLAIGCWPGGNWVCFAYFGRGGDGGGVNWVRFAFFGSRVGRRAGNWVRFV